MCGCGGVGGGGVQGTTMSAGSRVQEVRFRHQGPGSRKQSSDTMSVGSRVQEGSDTRVQRVGLR